MYKYCGDGIMSNNLLSVPENIHTSIFDHDRQVFREVSNDFDYTYLNLDYDTVRTNNGKPSIKISYIGNPRERNSRECFFGFVQVKPGDHIEYSAWAKTSDFPNTYRSGAQLICDMVAKQTDGRLRTVDSLSRNLEQVDGVWRSGDGHTYYECVPKDGVYPLEGIGNPVITTFNARMGTSEWTYIKFDFIIPDTVYWNPTTKEELQICYIAPNMDVREFDDDSIGWLTDFELYINKESGGELEVTVTFNGTVNDESTNVGVANATGVITITGPESDTIPITTDVNGNFTINKDYSIAGSYQAIANFNVTGYNPATSNTVSFTVAEVLGNIVITLAVSVNP